VTTLQASVVNHPLAAPTADDFRSALRAVTGYAADEVWAQVCRAAQLDPLCSALSGAQMTALAAAISDRPGRVGLLGRDIGARVATYRALADVGEPDAAAVTSAPAPRARTASSAERLDEIVDLDLFSPANREALDNEAREVAATFGASVGLVSIVLDHAQLFAGAHGLEGWLEGTQGTPVEWSLCATTAGRRQPYVVPDASADPVLRTNPLVAHDGVTSYAGVPMITSTGQVLGAFCLIDPVARIYSQSDIAMLQSMADEIVATLETRRLSRLAGGTDPVGRAARRA
jgi:GAF domain-containing protein